MAYENCTRCGRMIEEWDDNYMARGMLCPTCYSEGSRRASEKSALCTRCGIRMAQKDANLKLGKTLCQKCYEEEVSFKKEHFCALCKKKIEGASFEREDGQRLCVDCMRGQTPGGGGRSGMRTCDRCGRDATARMVTPQGENICMDCAQKARSGGFLSNFFSALVGRRR